MIITKKSQIPVNCEVIANILFKSGYQMEKDYRGVWSATKYYPDGVRSCRYTAGSLKELYNLIFPNPYKRNTL